MRRGKKFILMALLTIVVLAGTIGGVVLAADNGDDSQPKAQQGALLEKVCDIYNANPDRPGDIDCDLLKDAFTQAGNEMRDEALDKYLDELVAQGKIDDQQAQDYKAWLDSRPADIPFQLGPKNHGGIKPFGGFGGRGGGFRGWCEPGEPAE